MSRTGDGRHLVSRCLSNVGLLSWAGQSARQSMYCSRTGFGPSPRFQNLCVVDVATEDSVPLSAGRRLMLRRPLSTSAGSKHRH
ncbi:hypothetical protein ACRALDRAFT_2061093 [Sodiomyces alcalophilus JCM 7366]|uniref:uncharacterized protein n=1 Tax=Sodiomyces alcalophilus JCM 7366 TaxID=591952 RepID=UPI0039B49C53